MLTRTQCWILTGMALAFGVAVAAAEFLMSAGATDRIHAAADVATIANSMTLPVSLLTLALTLKPPRKRGSAAGDGERRHEGQRRTSHRE